MRKKAGLLFLVKTLRIPLNLLLLSLTAKYFGVSIEKDVWLLAFTAMTVLDAALWGPINETFRTKFVFIKEQHSADKAISQTQSLLTYFILFSVLIVVIIMLIPNVFSNIIAPNYDEDKIRVLQNMLYIVAPVLLFNQLMQIGISILNAYEIFFIGEFAALFSTFINIVLLYLFAENIGIVSLPLSYYVSTTILISFIVFFIIKHRIPLFKKGWNFRFNGFKVFFLFSISFFLPYFFGQVNSLIEKILASNLGTGAVSILDFSNKIPTLMNGFVVSVITTILVPILSKHYVRGEYEKYTEEFKKLFQSGLLFIGIIVAFFSASSKSIVDFLYNRGTISEQNLIQISNLSIIYSISLLGIFFYIIFGMSLLSSQNQKYYAIMGMFAQLLVIIINITFDGLVGIYIFPISIFISHIIFGWLMYRRFPYMKYLHLDKKYFVFILIIILCSYFGIKNIQLENSIATLTLQFSCLLILIISLCVILKIEEIMIVNRFIKNLRKTNGKE